MVKPEINPPGQITFASELARKATHMGALIVPLGYYILGLSRVQMLDILVPCWVLMIIIDVSRLRNWWLWRKFGDRLFRPLIRAHEQAGDFTGAFYILGAMVVTIALFSKPIAIAALSFTIVGDTLAALGGRLWGRHRLGARKTVEGTLAGLLGCILVALAAPHVPLWIGLPGAAVAAVTETATDKTDDNVTVPLVSGLAMTLLLKWLG
jgi:dolichol kinase